ncbi:MAG: hypothetical protein IJ600_10090 [Lachnospiraceae bacterium]|nr:hypothetical protein [Lachnospiraceae bacterium]
MGKLFHWLDRGKAETVVGYDNRINRLQAFHAGYAFLSWENYSAELCAFAAYAVWNGEFNAKLENPMPSGGFMMHCTPEQAQELCAFPDGFPLFVKLLAKQGRLYVENMVLADQERVYDFYFNGCEVTPPERLRLVFAGQREPADAHREEYLPEKNAPAEEPKRPQGSAGSLRGSYRRGSAGSYLRGSFVAGSYRLGAYRWGSAAVGSYRSWLEQFSGSSFRQRGISGSYYGAVWGNGSFGRSAIGSGRFFTGGSWRFGGWLVGSYRFGGFGGSYAGWRGQGGSYQGFGSGSFAGGSYRGALFGIGSYAGGSFRILFGTGSSFLREAFYTGSYIGGCYRHGSFLYSGLTGVAFLLEVDTGAELPAGEEAAALQLYPGQSHVRRLIEEMGYGLDLI